MIHLRYDDLAFIVVVTIGVTWFVAAMCYYHALDKERNRAYRLGEIEGKRGKR